MHYNYCNTSIPQPYIKHEPLEIKSKQKKNIKTIFIS